MTRRRRKPTVSSRPDWPPLRTDTDTDTTAREVVAQLLDRERAIEPDPHSDWVASHFVVRAMEYALDLTGSPAPPFDDAAVRALCAESDRRLYEDDDLELLHFTDSADIDVMAEVLKVDLTGRVQPAHHPPPRFAAPSSGGLISSFGTFSDYFSEDDPSTWVVQRVVGDYDFTGRDAVDVVDRFVATWAEPTRPSLPWIEVGAGIAQRLLIAILHKGWSGRPGFSSPDYAVEGATAFLGCFGPHARFFTNLDTESDSEPLLNATRFAIHPGEWWDAGVIALDGRHIGYDWRTADAP